MSAKKVAILGTGAMGTVMGAYITKSGLPIDLVDNYKDHVDALNKSGAHIVGRVDLTVPVHAMTPDEMQGIYDSVFLFTKQTANDVALPKLLKHLSSESTVCTLQNGVPEPYVAEYVGEERTVGGTVLWGATFMKPGVSELTQDITLSDHLFEIGTIDGSVGQRVKDVAEILERMGRPTKITTSLMASRWGKLINNACMSGMSAACGTTFGDILNNAKTRACLSYIAREVKQCCEADGYKLPVLLGSLSPDSCDLRDQAMFDENQRMFLTMYDDLRTAKASMLQDLEAKRQTEVPMINGYVCKTGDKHGIETPFCDKVVEIVSGIEAGKYPLSIKNVDLFEDKLITFKY
jgi:2-dehydropantoate 2-reductase